MHEFNGELKAKRRTHLITASAKNVMKRMIASINMPEMNYTKVSEVKEKKIRKKRKEKYHVQYRSLFVHRLFVGANNRITKSYGSLQLKSTLYDYGRRHSVQHSMNTAVSTSNHISLHNKHNKTKYPGCYFFFSNRFGALRGISKFQNKCAQSNANEKKNKQKI